MSSINRDMAKSLAAAVAADTITTDGDIGAAGIVVVNTQNDLPASADAGDRAFVDSSNRYYIHSGSGWYNIALINTNPTITSVVNGDGDSVSDAFNLSNDGTPVDITITATDPEGVPVTYTATTNSDFDNLASISQDSSVFTITPFSEDSATSSSGTVTFRATDGVNIATALRTFTLSFSTVNSRYTSLLAKASGNNGSNTSITDGSSNNHTITLNGGVNVQSFSPYHPKGYCLSFDGSGDDIAVSSQLVPAGPFTVQAWVKFEDTNTSAVWAQGTSGNVGRTGVGRSTDGTWFAQIGSTQAGRNSDYSPQANVWYFTELQWDGSTLEFFVDGFLQGSASGSQNPENTTFRVGSLGSAWSSTYDLTGQVADVKVISGTPSGTSTVPNTRLEDETNCEFLGARLPYIGDASSNNRSITVNGDTKVEPFGPHDYDAYDASRHGSSVYFDGSGDYMGIPANDAFSFGAGDFTIEAWVYIDIAGAMTGSIPIVGWDTGSYKIIRLNSSGINVESNSPSNQSFTAAFPEQAVTKVWNHIAIVRSGNSFTAYLNGKGGTPSTYSGNVGNGTDQLNIGYKSDPVYYKGFMADLRIVKGTAVYTSDFTTPTAPLSAVTNTSLLTCNDAPDVYDASGNMRVALFGVTSANLNTKYTSNIALDGGTEYVFFHPTTGSHHNDVTGDFTVETWIRLDSSTLVYPYLWIIRDLSNTGGPRIIARFGDSGFGYHLQFEVNGTGFEAVHSVNLTQSDFNTYRHVALTRSNGVVKCFVDGTQYSFNSGANPSSFPNSTISFSNSITNIDQLYIGYAVDGQMEDFRFTNGVARYPFIPLRETLTTDASTKFLTGHASTITDGSDDNHTITASGAFASGFGPGPGMNSISFDGSNDYLRCDAALDWDGGPGQNFTIEGWAYFNTIESGLMALLGINKASDGNNHLLFGATSANGFVIYWDGGPSTPIGVTVNTKKWYHWAVVYTGVRIEVYINGVHVHSVTDTTATRLQDCTLLIGAEADAANAGTIGNYLDGYISNFRISSGKRYTPNFTPPTLELLG